METTRRRLSLKSLGVVIACALLLIAAPHTSAAKEHPLGDIPVPPEIYKKLLKPQPRERAAVALPSSYDARTEGIVTLAKNQGSCGSCWAFACTGAMESHVLREYGFGPTDLAEQQLLVCSGYGSCDGGNAYALFHWDTSSDGRGPNYEGDFPYTAVDTTDCTEDDHVQIPYRVVDFHSVRTTDDSGNPTAEYFKESLYLNGPSYWRYTVYTDFDTYWAYGTPDDVYTGGPGAGVRGGHAVLLIGWDDSRGALLCKNSWGTYGGPNGDGTFWISYTGHAQPMGFGMYNFGVVQAGCVAEICGDRLDNDCDGLVDCDDADCDGHASCGSCGDGRCEGDETAANCPDDCNCGNGTCEPGDGEDMCACAEDCGAPPLTETNCSDRADNDCDGLIDCSDPDCADDLACTCGDDVCDGNETCANCPIDCLRPGVGNCGDCFKGQCDGQCHPVKDKAACKDCAPDICCGDGSCEGEEDAVNCPRDCDQPDPVCGDGTCNPGEDKCSCAADCGDPDNTETSCSDGVDNDCDELIDCADSDCSTNPACTCRTRKEPCSVDEDCCSGRCFRGACK